MAERTCCVWCPDWPVVALRRRDRSLLDAPVAVLDGDIGRGDNGRGGIVRAASREARTEGVVVGLRRREAEARCAGLVVAAADPHVEARAFEAVAAAVETITPRLVLERPGLLTFATRGPSRYFGGDDGLAAHVRDAVLGVGVDGVRTGIADGRFAARLAARAAVRRDDSMYVVTVDATAEFLAPWSVRALGDPELADLLVRLGLRTLGAFAALPEPAVVGRFGATGRDAHRLARGLDEHAAPPAPPPPELTETAELDPPAVRVETAAFVAKGLADRLLERLGALGLACTRVRIEAETEHGEQLARCWRHEGALTPAALATRVRWQLEGWLAAADDRPHDGSRVDPDLADADIVTGGLALLRLVPDEVTPATGRQLGFWGGDAAAGDRAARVLTRVQAMLGHDAVATAVQQGGRTPAERVRWVPWGDPREPESKGAQEIPGWPGQIPGPAPARVFDPPLVAELLGAGGQPVTVSGRGAVSGAPMALRCERLWSTRTIVVESWAGPWPHDVRWWDRLTRRRRVLWQVVVDTVDTNETPRGGDHRAVACLVAVEQGRAGVEALYD